MSEKPPFFSVVIPLYNRNHMIERTIRSVLDQSFTDFEIIVVDDGSTDNPLSVLEKINDKRVHIIRQQNQGASAARNAGIDKARGDYVVFLDSDDIMLPSALTTISHAINKGENRGALTSFYKMDRGNGRMEPKPSRAFLAHENLTEYFFCSNNSFSTSGFCVNSQSARELHFDNSLPKLEDIDFFMRLFMNGVSFYFIKETLVIMDRTNFSNKLSQTKHGPIIEKWFDDNHRLFTESAAIAFQANYLSYEIASYKPALALKYIVRGFLTRQVSLKRTLHSFGRAFFPEKLFRIITKKLIQLGFKS